MRRRDGYHSVSSLASAVARCAMANKMALTERRYGGLCGVEAPGMRRIKHAILPNEPTVLRVKTGIYVVGWQGVAQRKREVFRWVRFGKRTHREGVLRGVGCKNEPKLTRSPRRRRGLQRSHFGSLENVCGNLRFGAKAFILLLVG